MIVFLSVFLLRVHTKVIVPTHGLTVNDFELNQTATTTLGQQNLNMSSCAYFPQAACVGVTQSSVDVVCDRIINKCLDSCYSKLETPKMLTNDDKRAFVDRTALCNAYESKWQKGRKTNKCFAFECSIDDSVLKLPGEVFAQSNTSLFVMLRDPLERVVAQYNERLPGNKQLCHAPLDEHKRLFAAELNATAEKYLYPMRPANATTMGGVALDSRELQTDLIVRSLYDRMLHFYRGATLDVLFTEDIQRCSEALFEALRRLLPRPLASDAAMRCMRDACDSASDEHVSKRRRGRCTEVTAKDIPEHVAEFLRMNNRFYYKESPYFRQKVVIAEQVKEGEPLSFQLLN